MSIETFEELEEGDQILFNDRKHPLEVEAVDENRIHVEGPQGGEYILFPAEDDPELVLVARKGSRRYASKVEDLRKTGEWKQVSEDRWEHTSGTSIELVENESGFWTIETGLEADIPRYGFSSREFAEENAEGLVDDNPEG
ncbi:MAG: hypothetical protein ABEJ07_04595 [Candidatus Nanohaloarchaea archaeon]